MSNYSQSYKAFSKTILQSNKDLIDQWSKDNSNPELSEACKMMIQAAHG